MWMQCNKGDMTAAPSGDGVLVPESDSAKSLTCVRSLGSRGIRTIVAAEDPSRSPAAASRYCDETVTVPSPHENLLAYKNALQSFAARDDVATIIPNREEDAFVLARYRSEFAAHVAPVWPSFEALAVAQDGFALAEAAAEAGIRVPETQLFDDVTDWDRELILKARYAVLTDAYADFLGPTECEGQIPPRQHSPGDPPDRQEVLDHMLGHVPVVQEYVPIGTEYSVRALYDEGEAVMTSVRRQDRGMSYAGGASVFRQLVENPELEALARRLLDHLEWHGLATVQFIEEAGTGAYWLLEINPRTWTSIPCDVRAGADYPYAVWQLAVGDREGIDPTHEVGFATHLLYGEVKYLTSVLTKEYPNVDRPTFGRSVWEVLASVYTHPNFDYLTGDDPRPFLRAIRNQVAEAR